MNGLVDLTKKVSVILAKRGVRPDVKAQVGFAVDISGSMRHLYQDGTMQNIVNRIQALANRFDDNATLDMWAFHSKGFELEAAVPSMFGSYVNEHIMTHRDLWGGTSFEPVTKLIEQHYFGKSEAAPAGFFETLFGKKAEVVSEKSTDPVYLIFLTDGDNDDEKAMTQMIFELANSNIYIQFVGVGTGSSFRFVKKQRDAFNHVGFVDFSNPTSVTDEQMYEDLLNEKFVKWITK